MKVIIRTFCSSVILIAGFFVGAGAGAGAGSGAAILLFCRKE
jgi:hypothetical protein